MKKNKGGKKLNLKTIRIAKLNNLHLIKGGSDGCIILTHSDCPIPTNTGKTFNNSIEYPCNTNTVLQSSACERDPHNSNTCPIPQ